MIHKSIPELSSYPGYFQEPHRLSKGLPEISRVNLTGVYSSAAQVFLEHQKGPWGVPEGVPDLQSHEALWHQKASGSSRCLRTLCNSQACLNTLRPRQNGRHFADDTFKRIFLKENVWILIKISLKFVAKSPIDNIPALFQIMAWRRPGDKPLSEAMKVSLLTHICVAWPQWVNGDYETDTDSSRGCSREAPRVHGCDLGILERLREHKINSRIGGPGNGKTAPPPQPYKL